MPLLNTDAHGASGQTLYKRWEKNVVVAWRLLVHMGDTWAF